MGETDITFRHLFRGWPRTLLQLAFPRHRLEPLGPVDPSVDRPRQRTADNLFLVRDHSIEAVVHVETEREWRTDIPPRLFEYASAAVSTTQRPVWSVVVLLRSGGRPPSGVGEYRIPGIDGDAFVFRYHVVPLWQLDARVMREQLGLEGAPFYVAMQGADEEFIRSLAEEVLANEAQADREQQTTIRLIYAISAAIFDLDTAKRILNVESLMRHPNVRALFGEWEEKGRMEGRMEGRAEARVESARELLYATLASHSFPITQDVRTRIDNEPDFIRLKGWLEAVATARCLGDVFRDR